MKRIKNKLMLTPWFLAICVVVAGFIIGSADAQINYALMVQQTPIDGGVVTPEVGVHNVSANGAVTVSAMPKPGYQFVYWLGDVSDPAASSTVVSLNAPKIVVAVFERSEYELPFSPPDVPESVGGGSGVVPNRVAVGGGGDVSPAYGWSSQGYHGSTFSIIPPPQSPATEPPKSPPPVPDTDVPEPITAILLGVGSLLALSRKK